jgi:hypothetical protein
MPYLVFGNVYSSEYGRCGNGLSIMNLSAVSHYLQRLKYLILPTDSSMSIMFKGTLEIEENCSATGIYAIYFLGLSQPKSCNSRWKWNYS